MSILVLMYHRTPVEVSDFWDVAIDNFKRQIDLLVDSGAQFVPLSSAKDERVLASRVMHVALTFDDGHESNVEAVEHLVRLGVRPTLFVVRSWAETGVGEHGSSYLRRGDLEALSRYCDIGAHGVTHRSLPTLSPQELKWELRESWRYVGEILSKPAELMALPKGAGSVAVFAEAARRGFKIVRDSVFDVNTRPSLAVHAAAVHSGHDLNYPAELARQGRLFWTAHRVRRKALAAIRTVSPRRSAAE